MKTLASVVAVAVSLCAGWAAPCAAAPITFSFTGSVTETTFVPADPFGGAIGVGTAFSGSYTFESTTADSNPFASDGSFMTFSAPYVFNLDIGSFNFATSSAVTISTGNGAMDQYSVLACASGGPFCFGSSASLFMVDADGTALASDALPVTPPLLSAFELAALSFQGFIDGNQVQILGQLESLVCSAGCEPVAGPIPEPGSLILVGSALTMLAARLRRRRSQSSTASRQ